MEYVYDNSFKAFGHSILALCGKVYHKIQTINVVLFLFNVLCDRSL